MILIISVVLCFKAVSSTETPAPFNLSTTKLHSLVNTEYFVDKTDVVKALFQSRKKVVMVSTPRKFGKSVNMDIIKTFCELTAYDNGTRVPRELTDNYDLFKQHNLSVARNETFFNQHFGMYPTIYLDFKIVNYDTYRSFVESFKRLILSAFTPHYYLLKSKKLDSEDLLLFKEFYDPNQVRRKDDDELYNFVVILSFLLHKHFHKAKCLLLMDDFDAPVRKNIFEFGKISDNIVEIIFEFMSISFQSNPYFSKALITICTRLGPVMPGYNDDYILHHRFYNNSLFTPFHGFTEPEVEALLEKHNVADKMEEVREFYRGYRIMNSGSVYNPLSIVAYLVTGRLGDGWTRSCALEKAEALFLRKVVRQKMRELQRNGTKIVYLDKIYVKDILKLQKTIVNAGVFSNVDLFFQVMTDQGYFNIFNKRHDKVLIRIPNREISDYLNSKRNVSIQG